MCIMTSFDQATKFFVIAATNNIIHDNNVYYYSRTRYTQIIALPTVSEATQLTYYR